MTSSIRHKFHKSSISRARGNLEQRCAQSSLPMLFPWKHVAGSIVRDNRHCRFRCMLLRRNCRTTLNINKCNGSFQQRWIKFSQMLSIYICVYTFRQRAFLDQNFFVKKLTNILPYLKRRIFFLFLNPLPNISSTIYKYNSINKTLFLAFKIKIL